MSLLRTAAIASIACLPLVAMAGKGDNATIMHKLAGPDVVRFVEELGHRHELKADDVGDPLINAMHDNTQHAYQILFYECGDTHDTCKSIQFRAWFKHTTDIPAEELNEWNRTSRLGRAYLDSDRDPTIEHNVRLHGGITPAHLRAERDWFFLAMEKFKEKLGGRVE